MLGIILTESSVTAVIKALKGQKIVVPNLTTLNSTWRVDLHQDYPIVREELEFWRQRYYIDSLSIGLLILNRWISSEKERKKQKRVDAAMLSGYFWTGVPLDRYRTLAEFMSWVRSSHLFPRYISLKLLSTLFGMMVMSTPRVTRVNDSELNLINLQKSTVDPFNTTLPELSNVVTAQ
jgi:hypothetical protein